VCGATRNVTAIDDAALRADMIANTTTAVNLTYTQLRQLNLLPPESSPDLGPAFPPLYHTIVSPFERPTGLHGDAATRASIVEYYIAFSDGPVNMSSIDTAKFQYISFTLHYCTQSFNTTLQSNSPRTSRVGISTDIVSAPTTSVSSPWNEDVFNLYWGTSFCPQEMQGRALVLGPPPLAQPRINYTVDMCTALGISGIIWASVYGSYIQAENAKYLWNAGDLAQSVSLGVHGGAGGQRITDPAERMQNVDRIIQNVADSLTSMIRKAGTTYAGGDGAVYGETFAAQTIINVRWGWLSLLAVQVMLTAVILAVMVRMTTASGVQVLKDSSLATMCFLDPDTRTALGPVDDFKTVRERARSVKVTLGRGRLTSSTTTSLKLLPTPTGERPRTPYT
jgi:hypothetical protein